MPYAVGRKILANLALGTPAQPAVRSDSLAINQRRSDTLWRKEGIWTARFRADHH
jgi:hypothetical protein